VRTTATSNDRQIAPDATTSLRRCALELTPCRA
jgi:hypothetical protein